MARMYESAPVREVVVRRQFLMPDMLQLYSNPDILASSVKISFEGERGDDFGGLTKEVYTCFWAQAYRSFFRGENCKVPFMPLYRMRKESSSFTAIGRLLTHTVGLTKSLPSMSYWSCLT